MPAVLARVHPRFGTPWAAVIASSVCYSLCAFWSFKELIVLNIWLYSITPHPGARGLRGAAIPRAGAAAAVAGGGGSLGLWVTAGLPVALCALAMATAGWMNTAVGTLAVLTGPLAYLAWRDRSRAGAAAAGA